MPPIAPRVFLSHSEADLRLVDALVKLLLAGLVIDPKDIRCTSLPGFGLPGGVRSSDQIRAEVLAARVVLGVMSHRSAGSTWVLFELGARWAGEGPLIPVLGPGVLPNILKGPLSELNALSCETEEHLEELLRAVGEASECVRKASHFYRAELGRLLQLKELEERELEADVAAVRDFFAKAPRKPYYVTPVSRSTGLSWQRAQKAIEKLAELGELGEQPDQYGSVYRSMAAPGP